jgi:hypothetical protein
VRAYGECYPKLVQHDARYPKPDVLLQRTVPGYADSEEGVELILAAVDSDDPRPVWFLNWGTDHGSAPSCLRRALDRVDKERGPDGYAAFKSRLRLSSDDQFGEHTTTREPPFKLWVDTFRPEVDGKRWYHTFSRLTATAGGFDLAGDVLTVHGPLGALYPTNTTHRQKEGDTMTFLYLMPTGMNDPDEPTWGSWAGRYGRNDEFQDRPYYWADVEDDWQGRVHRDNSLKRWAVHIQNDFKARMDWCVNDYAGANHPPVVVVNGPLHRHERTGEKIALDASASSDPDEDELQFEWFVYREPGSYRGPVPEIRDATTPQASFVAPDVDSEQTIHIIASITDAGSPPLTRYARAIVTVTP